MKYFQKCLLEAPGFLSKLFSFDDGVACEECTIQRPDSVAEFSSLKVRVSMRRALSSLQPDASVIVSGFI